MTPRGGTPQLTFRQGELGPDLRARVATSANAQTPAQVAQRDLGRYYALLAEGRAQLALRPEGAARNAITMPDDPSMTTWVKTLTPLERAALEDLRERYEAAETEGARAKILQEIEST